MINFSYFKPPNNLRRRYAIQMIKFLSSIILLISYASAYAWQCQDDTPIAFKKAKEAYVIKIKSKTEENITIPNEPDEKKFLVKYEVAETLKGKNENLKGEVIDIIGLLPNHVDFEVGYYYILFLYEVSDKTGKKSLNRYVTGCNVHAKSKTLEDSYFLSVLNKIRR